MADRSEVSTRPTEPTIAADEVGTPASSTIAPAPAPSSPPPTSTPTNFSEPAIEEGIPIQEPEPRPPSRRPSPRTHSGKLQFADLSRELQLSILEHVIRPSDLKNVCLVNKHFHEIAVRFLYHQVNLDLGSPNDARLSSFLNPRNIGLPHIRHLRLYLHVNPTDRCLNQEQQAHFATRMLLEFLPEDILDEFSWCPWQPFSANNLLLLYKKQRKMKWLEAINLDKPVLADLRRDTRLQEKMFQNVKKLALYPETQETLDLSGYFVEKVADELQALTVHCHFHGIETRDAGAIDARELLDSATGPGLMMRSIFRSRMPFDEVGRFPHLTSLHLHRVSLRHCAESWLKLVNFHELQNLRLFSCSGADTLLGQMCKSNYLPKQLRRLEIQHRDNSENELIMALDGLLCLLSGIEDMVIDLEHVTCMPAAVGIIRHSNSLEKLNVHCAPKSHSSPIPTPDGDTDELYWDTEEFEKICNACKGLVQLSCAWPPTSLIRFPSEEWRAYESATWSLPNLITLQITTWPTNKPSTQLLPRVQYEILLQGLARRQFEHADHAAAAASRASESSSTSTPTHLSPSSSAVDLASTSPNSTSVPLPTRSRLRLIAFGISDKIYERENTRNQITYLRSTCQDAEGQSCVYATPLRWVLHPYVEPRSDILDVILNRSDPDNRPPCRESGPLPGSSVMTIPVLAGAGGVQNVVWGDEDD